MEIVIVTEGMDGLTRERWEFWIRSEHSDSCITAPIRSGHFC